MKKLVQGIFIGLLISTFYSVVLAGGISHTINVFINSVNISLNGEKITSTGENYKLANGKETPYSIVYKGTTYLPIRKVAELVNLDVNWDGKIGTVVLGKSDTSEVIKGKSEKKASNKLIRESYSTYIFDGETYMDKVTLEKIYSYIDRDINRTDEASTVPIASILRNGSILVNNADNGEEHDVIAYILENGKVIFL
ncbi:MAG: copper amine oxidase N-terminal domain-containing protein [Vallitalea sp.]|jgi:hypothetical protein|nr:copper amine oxidase N-terminal domain-containing protein [Vallitalea sp.]